jgi:hypothetical protein
MVNHAPVPAAQYAATDINTPGTIYVSKLLLGATDPDVGDVITFVNAGPASTQGGTVVTNLSGGVPAVTYTPPTGFSGTDYFSYTITDGKAVATGTVTVDVRPASALTFNMLPLIISNNLPLVRFSGTPGYTYRLQRSSDLNSWTDLPAIALPSNGNGIGSYYDTAAPSTNGYYRTHYPP